MRPEDRTLQTEPELGPPELTVAISKLGPEALCKLEFSITSAGTTAHGSSSLPLAQQAVNKLADDDPSNVLGSSDVPFHTTVSSVADSLVACSDSVDGVTLTGLQSDVLPSVGSVAPMVSRPTNSSYHFQLAGCA